MKKAKQDIKTEICVNCGTRYSIKKSIPEICWACGMPTQEKTNEV